MCWLSWNLGASTSWNPQGLSRSVMGVLYLFLSRASLIQQSWFTVYLTCFLILSSHLRIDLQNYLVQISDWYVYGCIRYKQIPGARSPWRLNRTMAFNICGPAVCVEFGSCRPVFGACNFEVASRFLVNLCTRDLYVVSFTRATWNTHLTLLYLTIIQQWISWGH